jgi:hypothetical protein
MNKILVVVIVLLFFLIMLIGCSSQTYPTTQPLRSNTSMTTSNPPKTQDTQPYQVVDDSGKSSFKDLKTLGHWTGEYDKNIDVKIDKTPAVVNYGYIKTSTIHFEFEMWAVLPNTNSQLGTKLYNGSTLDRIGTYTIRIKATGCTWELMIGVEP